MEIPAVQMEQSSLREVELLLVNRDISFEVFRGPNDAVRGEARGGETVTPPTSLVVKACFAGRDDGASAFDEGVGHGGLGVAETRDVGQQDHVVACNLIERIGVGHPLVADEVEGNPTFEQHAIGAAEAVAILLAAKRRLGMKFGGARMIKADFGR